MQIYVTLWREIQTIHIYDVESISVNSLHVPIVFQMMNF